MSWRTEPVGITRDAIVDCAIDIIDREGGDALSMRKLAASLGVKPASIYWHVGNRDALLDAIGARLASEFETLTPIGDTPEARLLYIARGVRARMLARTRVTDLLVHEVKGIQMLVGPRNAILREFAAAGLSDPDAVQATRAFVFQVTGFVLAERASSQFVERIAQGRAEVPGIEGAPGGDALAAFDPDALFEFSVARFLAALLGEGLA
ncbi:MAG: TetR/AcrR family transcriptional regulator [Acidimicrobiia bacterium]